MKRRKPSKERKESRVQLRMTEEQRRAMDEAAKKAGLDLSSWIRMVALKAAESSE
jgi:uncharacterized protein (DUF1778 family)